MESSPENNELFKPDAVEIGEKQPGRDRSRETPRIIRPQRDQKEVQVLSLDDLIPENHTARDIWTFVEQADFSIFEDLILSVEGGTGRPVSDRRVYLAIWLYAIANGINSGRQIVRLCGQSKGQTKFEGDSAFRWLAGNVPLNYHTMDSFRSENGDPFEELLKQCLAAMMNEGLVTLFRIAVDGTKIRANASPATFHKEEKLNEMLKAAEEHIDALNAESEVQEDWSKKKKAANLRAAREKWEKCRSSLENLKEIRKRKKKDKKDAKASVTEGDARTMRFPQNKFQPGYNVQVAQDLETGVIAAAEVTQDNEDSRGLIKIISRFEKNTNKKPEIVITDMQYPNHVQMDEMDKQEIEFLAPIKKNQSSVRNCSAETQYIRENSTINAETQEITCPAKVTFKLSISKSDTPSSDLFGFTRKKQSCLNCPLFEKCCPDGKINRYMPFHIKTKRHLELMTKLEKINEEPDSKELLKMRFCSEHTNAHVKSRMGRKFHVNNISRTQSETTLSVLAHNVLKWRKLRAETQLRETA